MLLYCEQPNMRKEAQKRMTVPRVTESTISAVTEAIRSGHKNEYFSQMLQALELENPLLADFVKSHAKKALDPPSALITAVFAYGLLAAQAASDETRLPLVA